MDRNKKKKIFETNNETQLDESINEKIIQKESKKKGNDNVNKKIAHNDGQKEKMKKLTPVKKTTGNSNKQDAMSKGFIVEEMSVATEESTNKKKTIVDEKKTKPKKTLTATIPQTNKSKTKISSNKPKRLKGGVNKKIVKAQKSKNSTVTFSKTSTISDERLRAFGLNPKKFHKKLKYGNKSTASETVIKTKNVASKTNKLAKLNQKKIKRKLLTVLGK